MIFNRPNTAFIHDIIAAALAFFLSLGGGHDTINVALLWGYVILRVVHSIIQNTTNIVAFRFYAFVASSLCLVVIVVRELIRVFFG